MAGETIITVIGNLTADVELRWTQQGVAVANFTVASTPRLFDKKTNEWRDGEALFLRCTVWREVAENVSNSLTKGMRVIVSGALEQRNYEVEGQKRTSYEMSVDEVGPSLKYATAQVTRTPKGQGGHSASAGAPVGGSSSGDGWAVPGASQGFDNEAPF